MDGQPVLVPRLRLCRHRRMEEVRIRKENQVYTAAERRSLAEFHHTERARRENQVLSSLRDLVHDRLHRVAASEGRTRTRDGTADEDGRSVGSDQPTRKPREEEKE
jgi:hypothetical protein